METAPQFQRFVPNISAAQVFEFLQESLFIGQVTGWVFAVGLAVFLISIFLSLTFFALSAGNLGMVERSRQWLIFGCIWVGITGLIWGIFQIVILIFSQ